MVREIKVPFGEPLKLEISAFLDCIRKDTSPPVSGDDGIRVLEVLDSCNIELWPDLKMQRPDRIKTGTGI